MIIQVRIKKNCPKTYIERITKEKYIAYISRVVPEYDVDEAVLHLVSKEFMAPKQKISMESASTEDRIIEIQ